MYGESWAIKKAERQRIDAFKLWGQRRLLRVPWTARSSNQSILKEVSPEYSLEGRRLKLKLQYFGTLMERANSLEKTSMLGKIEDKRRRKGQRMQWLGIITDSMDVNLSKFQEMVKTSMLQSVGLPRVRYDLATEQVTSVLAPFMAQETIHLFGTTAFSKSLLKIKHLH